jgi:hypothetical protein
MNPPIVGTKGTEIDYYFRVKQSITGRTMKNIETLKQKEQNGRKNKKITNVVFFFN